MSSDAAKAVALREALKKRLSARSATGGAPSQARLRAVATVWGCTTCRLTRHNLELLETLLQEGKSVDCFRACFTDGPSATVATSLGPLCVRSPGRAPVLPMKEPEPVKGVMKEVKQTKKLVSR